MKPVGARRQHGHDIPGFDTKFRGGLGESRNIVAPSVNAQLTHSAAECVRVEIQNSCRALWSVNHSRSSIQSGEDMIAFHLLKTWEQSFRRRALFSAMGGSAFGGLAEDTWLRSPNAGVLGEKRGQPRERALLRARLHAR